MNSSKFGKKAEYLFYGFACSLKEKKAEGLGYW